MGRTLVARYGRWRSIAALAIGVRSGVLPARRFLLFFREQSPPWGWAPSIRAIHEGIRFDRSLDVFPAIGPMHWTHYPFSDLLQISGKADVEAFRRWAA